MSYLQKFQTKFYMHEKVQCTQDWTWLFGPMQHLYSNSKPRPKAELNYNMTVNPCQYLWKSLLWWKTRLNTISEWAPALPWIVKHLGSVAFHKHRQQTVREIQYAPTVSNVHPQGGCYLWCGMFKCQRDDPPQDDLCTVLCSQWALLFNINTLYLSRSMIPQSSS